MVGHKVLILGIQVRVLAWQQNYNYSNMKNFEQPQPAKNMSTEKPEEIDVGFKVNYKKLWDLDISVEEIDISKLEANLDFPYLEQEGTDDWNLTPRMLIDNFAKEISHAKKVEKTDLDYPIEIYFHNDNWIILDGIHRYVKALMRGDKTIKVRRVSKEMLNKVRNNY